jgi:hypothetical protein
MIPDQFDDSECRRPPRFEGFACCCFLASAFIANGTFVLQGVWTLLSGLG